MMARVTGYPRSLWCCHSLVLAQLALLSGTYYNGDGAGPLGTIMGRPLHVSEHMNPLGDAGDIALVDPAAHFVALRGPTNSGPAIGYAFRSGPSRLQGGGGRGVGPLLGGTVTRWTGSDVLGSVVRLAERS